MERESPDWLEGYLTRWGIYPLEYVAKGVAQDEYEAESGKGELSFEAGDLVLDVKAPTGVKLKRGWGYGKVVNKGFVPLNYIRFERPDSMQDKSSPSAEETSSVRKQDCGDSSGQPRDMGDRKRGEDAKGSRENECDKSKRADKSKEFQTQNRLTRHVNERQQMQRGTTLPSLLLPVHSQ